LANRPRLQAGLLTVRQTKFDKSGYVPLHPSTTEALRGYQGRRNLYLTAREDSPFFVGTRGRRLGCELSLHQVDRIFQQLRDQLGWVNRSSHPAIRVHDLRHHADNRIMPNRAAGTRPAVLWRCLESA